VTEREPLSLTPEQEAEDRAFFRRYGPWSPFDPPRVAEFMAGFPRPWWLVGGWAIEAFSRAPREHEDVDLTILACDVPALREHVDEDQWHLWSNNGGLLRPLDDRFPDPQAPDSQIWVRRSAVDPWVIDLPITPDLDGLWTNKRMPDHVAPVEAVTWIADDGIRYLNPEIALLYKAGNGRAKDDRDLDRCLPLLSRDARTWLRDSVTRVYPGHAWLDRLA
jgi:hypothetical protein